MGNIATSVDKQIEILESRKMVLDRDIEKVKEILLDIGYYRLGFYWNPFEIDQDHNLRPGTKSSTIIDLYYLDADLRLYLNKALKRIELNFRTKLIYYVSCKYKDAPTWFNDEHIVSRSYRNDLKEYYNDKFRTENLPIKKHHENYINDRYAPAWKTIEFFSFGGIIKLFNALKDEEIQKRISELYDVSNIDKFKNFLRAMAHVRNCCAHSSVMFDLNLPRSINSFPHIEFNDPHRNNLDACIKLINYILNQISESRSKEFIENVESLFKKHSENPDLSGIIKEKIGYVE